MKQNDAVFELIKSLSKPEKRYFKLDSVSKQSSIYIELFNAMEKEKDYDEKKFKIKYSGKRFIKNFAYNKIYLHDGILSSLTKYNSNKSVDARLREMISGIELLKQKGLMQQAQKLTDRAYMLAEENEKHYYQLLILSGKADLRTLITNPDEREVFREGITNRIYEIHDKIINQMKFITLSTRIMKFMNIKGGIRTEQDRDEVNEILNDEILRDISYAKTLDSKCYFYFTKHLCYLSLGQLEKAYEFSKEGIGILKGADINKSLMRGRLRTALGAHLLLLKYFPEKESEFIDSLRKYREAVYPDRNIVPGRFIDSYNSEILFNIKKADFRKNIAVLKELESSLSGHESVKQVSEYFFLASNAAYSEFICGNYSSSLKWLNIALKEKENVISYKAITSIMALSLVIHYELKNYDLLEYQMISTYRYLIRKKRLYKYETLVLDFIRSTVKNMPGDELMEKFGIIKNKLVELSADENEAAVFEDFDLISWLECKIQNKTFESVLKEKAS